MLQEPMEDIAVNTKITELLNRKQEKDRAIMELKAKHSGSG
jgi:hypothetical protein